MKRFFCFLFVLVLLPVVSFADLPDISGLSYSELVELKNRINLAMWNSEEWQEVVVPVGVWQVGSDIPVGEWNISVSSDSPEAWGTITYCDSLDESGLGPGNILYSRIYHYEQLFSKNSQADNLKSINIDCKFGTYIIIEFGNMLFTPSTGKPDLGFKK